LQKRYKKRKKNEKEKEGRQTDYKNGVIISVGNINFDY